MLVELSQRFHATADRQAIEADLVARLAGLRPTRWLKVSTLATVLPHDRATLVVVEVAIRPSWRCWATGLLGVGVIAWLGERRAVLEQISGVLQRVRSRYEVDEAPWVRRWGDPEGRLDAVTIEPAPSRMLSRAAATR